MKVTTVMTDGILSKVSFETESISENIIDVIQDFLYQQEKTDTEILKEEKVETPIKKKKVAKKKPIEVTAPIEGSFKRPTYVATGNLTAKVITEEEIEVIEDSFALPLITPQEAFEVNEPLKEAIIEKAPAPLKPIIEEKVVVATMKKAENAVKEPKVKIPLPPISDVSLQPKDVIEQIKKNKGENYLNRRGVMVIVKDIPKVAPPPVVEEVVVEEELPTLVMPEEDITELKERFDEVIRKAVELGFPQKSIDAIKWEQNNTDLRISQLEKVIKDQEAKKKNK